MAGREVQCLALATPLGVRTRWASVGLRERLPISKNGIKVHMYVCCIYISYMIENMYVVCLAWPDDIKGPYHDVHDCMCCLADFTGWSLCLHPAMLS